MGVAAIVAVGLIAGAVLYVNSDSLPPVSEWRNRGLQILQSIPAPLYFLAFAILPALGMPLTAFYLTALPILGAHGTLLGLGWAYLALALNITFTGLLTQTLIRPVIDRIILNKGWSIPKLKPENEWQIVLAFRLSPLPFVGQNYLLALAGSRWRYYLGLSLGVQAAIGTGMMLVGESLFRGGMGFLLLAIFILIVLTLVSRALRKKLNAESSGEPKDA